MLCSKEGWETVTTRLALTSLETSGPSGWEENRAPNYDCAISGFIYLWWLFILDKGLPMVVGKGCDE